MREGRKHKILLHNVLLSEDESEWKYVGSESWMSKKEEGKSEWALEWLHSLEARSHWHKHGMNMKWRANHEEWKTKKFFPFLLSSFLFFFIHSFKTCTNMLYSWFAASSVRHLLPSTLSPSLFLNSLLSLPLPLFLLLCVENVRKLSFQAGTKWIGSLKCPIFALIFRSKSQTRGDSLLLSFLLPIMNVMMMIAAATLLKRMAHLNLSNGFERSGSRHEIEREVSRERERGREMNWAAGKIYAWHFSQVM